MTATTAEPVSGQRGLLSSLIHRQLDSYPDTGRRVMYLTITVLATITLYYELYVGGSVSTLILSNLGMTFKFYVATVAFGNLIGAFGSLFAGLTDRYGRANLVVFGLLFSGIFVTFILARRHQQVAIHDRELCRRRGRGRLPGRHASADPGLLPAGRPCHRDGLLDQRPGARQPDRRDRRLHHDPDRSSPTRGSGRTSSTSAAPWAWWSSWSP